MAFFYRHVAIRQIGAARMAFWLGSRCWCMALRNTGKPIQTGKMSFLLMVQHMTNVFDYISNMTQHQTNTQAKVKPG